MTAPDPPQTIALYGPFGWGNLGDAAIQEAMLHNARRRVPKARFVGISLNPDNTREIHGIDALPIRRSWHPRTHWKDWAREVRFRLRELKHVRRLDHLIVSGGGQISDDWDGPWDHPLSMLSWVVEARLLDIPVSMVSVGAGPFRHPRSAALFRAALRGASYRSYRDPGSKEFLARHGFHLPAHVYPDLAFSLPPRPAPGEGGRELHVGISPLSYFHPTPGAWPEQDESRYRRHLATMERFTRFVLDEGHAVSVFSSQIRNDRLAADDLREELSTAGRAHELRDATPTENLDHLLTQLAPLDVVVTSRLHGVILSYLHHKPVLSLSYDPKIHAVMRDFGQLDYCLDIATATPELVIERFRRLRADLDENRATIRARALHNAQRLQEQYDRLFGPVHAG